MEDVKPLDNYCILDDKLMIIEKSKDFPKNIFGDVSDITCKSKRLIDENDNQKIIVDIQFEKSNVTIMNKKDLTICALSTKTK